MTPRWQDRLSRLNLVIADMAARIKEQNIPFLLMMVPSAAESALLHAHHPPPHTHALAFGRAIAAIAAANEVGYIDVSTEFQQAPQSEHLFYVVDGHVNPNGQALISRALVRKCLDGSIPAFQLAMARTATE